RCSGAGAHIYSSPDKRQRLAGRHLQHVGESHWWSEVEHPGLDVYGGRVRREETEGRRRRDAQHRRSCRVRIKNAVCAKLDVIRWRGVKGPCDIERRIAPEEDSGRVEEVEVGARNRRPQGPVDIRPHASGHAADDVLNLNPCRTVEARDIAGTDAEKGEAVKLI